MNYMNNPNAIYSMLGSYGHLSDNIIWKNKKETACITSDPNYHNSHKDISYVYMDSPYKDAIRKQQVIQGVYNESWFKLEGKKNRGLRNTKNKFASKIIVTQEGDFSEVKELIDRWDNLYGIKYRRADHSGYDKRFFLQTLSLLPDEFIVFYFRDKETYKLLGYSVFSAALIPNENNIYEICYLFRKGDWSYSRNLCEYIDYKSYEILFKKIKEPFVVNLGASSAGVLKYKTMNFPIYEISNKYFYKVKKNDV